MYLNFKRGAKFVCPNCNATHNPVHDVVNGDRTWRHLNSFQYQTMIHASLPRVICKSCDKIHIVHVPWARSSTRLTWHFESLCTKYSPTSLATAATGNNENDQWIS
ncbi:transposase family protein [Tepidibacillus marianensis]|uniref:transposase family protein n=1 Tax=Tepidibacillus marianensis TaxID=3131995 RepID=UPI00338E69DD